MVFFRADANQHIASGHIMRCISIAQRFIARGEETKFIVADDGSSHILKEKNMSYVILHTHWDNLDGEIEYVKCILGKYVNPLIIVDSYYVTRNYVEQLIPYGRVCYLGSSRESLGNLYALINYSVNVDYDFYTTNYGKDTKLLLGPSFLPLREEFIKTHPQKSPHLRPQIILTTGGTNPNSCIEKILSSLVRSSFFPSIDVHVIIGSLFNFSGDLLTKYIYEENIIIHTKVKNMAELMREGDIAISANGTTVYEFMALHVPVISFAMVEEQLQAAKKMESLYIVEYCGAFYKAEKECLDNIVNKTRLYVEKSELRLSLSEKASRIIDKKGCDRIYNALMS